jgi:hypothetical protein
MRAVRPELASGAQSHLSRYAGDIQLTIQERPRAAGGLSRGSAVMARNPAMAH